MRSYIYICLPPQLIVLIILYLSSVHFFWSPQKSAQFLVAGQSMWIAIAGYLCSFLGALQVPVFLLIMGYVVVSTAYHLQANDDNESASFVDRLQKLFDRNDFERSLSNISICRRAGGEATIQSDVEDISLSDTIDSTDTLDAKQSEDAEGHQSDTYFKLLFYACLGTFLYRNIWMFILAAVPICLHLLYTLGTFTGITQFVYSKINDAYHAVRVSEASDWVEFVFFIRLIYLSLYQAWALDHHSAVLPLCLPGALELNYKINCIVRDSLKSSVESVTSILMIILMLLIIVFLSVFFCVNIYSETIEVAYLGKDLINKTITDRPELIDILPANIQASIDDALDNAHHYGRRKIETYIDDWLAEADKVHATKLKEQILDVWDRLIQYWIDFNKAGTSYGPRVPTDALKSTFGEIVDNPGKSLHWLYLLVVPAPTLLNCPIYNNVLSYLNSFSYTCYASFRNPHPLLSCSVCVESNNSLHVASANTRLFILTKGHFKELVLVAKQGIIGWAQSNTQTILEVAESLWHIIHTNLSMIMGVAGEILSLLLSGGQACIEFILDMVMTQYIFHSIFLDSSLVPFSDRFLYCTLLFTLEQSGQICSAADNQTHGLLSVGQQDCGCLGEFHYGSARLDVQVFHIYRTLHVAGAHSVWSTHCILAVGLGCPVGCSSVPRQLLVCSSRLSGTVAGAGSLLCWGNTIPTAILCALVIWDSNLCRS